MILHCCQTLYWTQILLYLIDKCKLDQCCIFILTMSLYVDHLYRQLVGDTGVVLSTDDFFTSYNGRYKFDMNMLTEAHDRNKRKGRIQILRLSVPLYGSHLRKWRTESRDWEQNKQKEWAARRGIPQYCSCAFVSNLPNNDSDWSVSKYSVKHDRHAVPRLTAPRTVPHCVNPDALERDSTHVYLCAHF